MDINIQRYKNATDNKGKPYTVAHAISEITNGILQDTTNEYRNIPPGELKDVFKKTQFAAVTWSGTFTKRKASELIEHSGLICIDIDKLTADELQGFKKLLRNDVHVFFMFVSPSNAGLKIIFKIPNDATTHKQSFLAISSYLQQEYSMVTDDSGKDVSRLCFLCHDVTAFYNEAALPFPIDKYTPAEPVKSTYTPKPFTPKENQDFTVGKYDTVEAVEEFTNRKIQLAAGNRNNWAHTFARNCCLKAIDISDCLSHCSSLMPDKDVTELGATIKSAYTHNAADFGKYKWQPKQRNNDNKPTQSKQAKSANTLQREATNETSKTNDIHVIVSEGSSIASPVPAADVKNEDEADEAERQAYYENRFWSVSINPTSGKETISLNYTKFFRFLQSRGFSNLATDETNVELIQVNENIVRPVIISKTRNDVKEHLNDYCEGNDLENVLEMLHRGEDKYFARSKFSNLKKRKIEFFKDTKDTSYHFHSNCVVECGKDGVTVRPYNKGEKALWASQINPRPFKRVSVMLDKLIDANYTKLQLTDTTCEFAQYQMLVSCKPDADVTDKVRMDRFLAHATSFGYLINNYKPSIGKAIVGVDHKKAIDRSEQNGRTGKGIFSKAIGYCTKRFAVDARRYDPKDTSAFEMFTLDCKVITMDDCHERFDFGNFFVPITEDFTLRKMYVGYITIPYEQSPKWYFNTNFTFKGDGGSFTGRQHIIEFDNYFTEHHTPIHHFGHSLFTDWDDEQWNLFYNYAYECDVLNKALDLVKYAEGNYMERKLTNECPQEFIDFVDAQEDSTKAYINLPRNQWQPKKKFIEAWNKEARELNMQMASAKLLYSMMKKCCQSKGVGFYTKKTNGEEYYWVGEYEPYPYSDSYKPVVSAGKKATTQFEIFKS